MADELILIDAYSQIFRAFYAIRQLTNSRGEPTNAVFVFTRLLLGIQKEYPTSRGAMLFDCGKVEFRMKLNPEYKANRPPMPEALRTQIPVIRELAEAFGWPLLEEPEYEADDLAAAFARAAEGPVKIISSDKDLAQLVDDRVTMLSPAPRNAGFEERGVAEITAKFQVPPALLIDYLALLGDSSDNIPGVPGIGAKGAAKLINTYGTASEWLEHPEKLAGTKFEKKLAGAGDILKRNQELIRLRSDLPERFSYLGAVLARREPDWAKLADICRRMALKSILKELPVVPGNAPEPDQDDLFPAASAAPAPETAPSPAMEQGELF